MAGVPVHPVDADVGAWLRTYRVTHDLSQHDVAAGVSNMEAFGFTRAWTQSTVSKIETGLRSIYLHELLALAQWVGMPVESLLAEALNGVSI